MNIIGIFPSHRGLLFVLFFYFTTLLGCFSQEEEPQQKLYFERDKALRPVEPIAGRLPWGLNKIKPDSIIRQVEEPKKAKEAPRKRPPRRFKPNANETVAIHATTRLEPMVFLDGGKYKMGVLDLSSTTGEFPVKDITVKPFKIDRYPVTNRDFAMFKRKKMKFISKSEEQGYSFVLFSQVTGPSRDPDLKVPREPWWLAVHNATWYEPGGPGSTVIGMENHPVVHVSYTDAKAYCHYVGKRLPDEYEWEYAARGGLKGKRYPWGDKYEHKRANLWQGLFPSKNEAIDGYAWTSPVDAFDAQNQYGLYDMIGNVWEWTSTTYEVFRMTMDPDNPMKVAKGASFVDSRDGGFNANARCSQRKGFPPSFAASNIGFRCAVSVAPTTKKPEEATTVRPRKRFRKEDTWAYKVQQAANAVIDSLKKPRRLDEL